MIDIRTVSFIVSSLFMLGGGIAAYVRLQTIQTMNIKQIKEDAKNQKEDFEKQIEGIKANHEKEINELKHKQSESTKYQINSEKIQGEMVVKLDRLLEDMKDLKAQGCGACKP